MAHPVRHRRNVAFAPGLADEAVLRLLGTYHYLTAQQICRALYSPGSLTRVQTIVKRLRDAGYIQAIFLPRRSQTGSAPSVYTLSRRGRLFLQRLGVSVSLRVRPSEERLHSYLFLAHTLCVNDVLLAVHMLAKTDRRIVLAGMRHERDLKRAPVAVVTAAGERIAVVPDGWIDIRVQDWQYCFVLELDRGTEEQKAWKRKVRGLVAFASGPYQAAFNTDSLTIAVLTTAGEKRCVDLRRWTEEELSAIQHTHAAGFFAVASLVPATTSPQQLFLGRLWQTPFTPSLQALIELEP